MRDWNAQRVAKQRGDREPVGDASDKPGLGGGLQEIGPVTGRQCVATQRDRTHQHQQKRREGAVPLKFAASFRVGVGFCHARKG